MPAKKRDLFSDSGGFTGQDAYGFSAFPPDIFGFLFAW